MAVASSVSAPCVATTAPVALTAEEAPNKAGDTISNDVSSCSSAPSKTDVTAAKPTPKSSFTAPKLWMVAFGVALAICAGTVNAACGRSLLVFVSHMTGTLSTVGMQIEGLTTGENMHWDVFHSVLLLSSFIFGSFLCGLVIPKNQVHFGGKSFYGVALLGNSCLLIAAACIAPAEPVPKDEHYHPPDVIAAGCLAAMACGLQNAMCTMHFGAIVRTTHVTGTATDIGSTAGRASMILLMNGCRRRKANEFERVELWDDAMKLFVLIPIFAGFLFGAILGAYLDTHMGIYALFVPATFTGITGLLYTFLRTQMKQQLKKFEERRLKDELDEMEVAIRRASSLLTLASKRERRENLEDVNDIIGYSLRVVHDVEATVAELCHQSNANAAELDRARTF